MPELLIVDPDRASRDALVEILSAEERGTSQVASASDALELLAAEPHDIVIVDLAAGEGGVRTLLEQLGKRWPEIQVLVSAGRAALPDAVAVLKAGASDFLMKPFQKAEVLRAVAKARAAAEHAARDLPVLGSDTPTLVGASSALDRSLEVIRRAASSNSTVLIRGESGTGKELAARAVHDQSPRSGAPFIKVHCAAIPDMLLESELFGYEKGAFTGAVGQKPGRIDLAEGGTLFLDEIGDISAMTQVKLLRLLQDRQFERLGGRRTITADVRFVAATHRDLEALVRSGSFREDLFYRLNVVTVWLPPLRARRSDIPELVRHFCLRFAGANQRDAVEFDKPALELLTQQRWPGNVRQLQNFVERLAVLATGRVVSADDVRAELSGQVPFETEPSRHSMSHTTAPGSAVGPLDDKLQRAERRALERALAKADNNRTEAARLLGVSRRTLYNKLQQYGML
jgi:two-component system response regulator AtoC